jgi:4-amino-4-deoxychorismate lyase
MNLVNGIEGRTVDPRDRGLCYGDGVFRTLKLRNSRPVLWQRQYAKLAADCAALRLDCPAPEILERDIATIAAAHPDGIVRVTLTRGVAKRGYSIPAETASTRIVSWSDSPRSVYAKGVTVRWCDLRLAIQPSLAGIKHLNRLENVLARSEWQDPEIAEGLLCDANGSVVSGTMSNVFLARDGGLRTPALDGCGVAGMMRDLVIEYARNSGLPIQTGPVGPVDVQTAEAVFLVNSVIGVWQVSVLEDRTWVPAPMTELIRSWIEDAERR